MCNPTGAGINGTATITINGTTVCQTLIVNGAGTCAAMVGTSGKATIVATFTGVAAGSTQPVTHNATVQATATRVAITSTTPKSTACRKAVVTVSGAAAAGPKVTLRMQVNGRWTKVGTVTPNKAKNWRINAHVGATTVRFRAQQGKSNPRMCR